MTPEEQSEINKIRDYLIEQSKMLQAIIARMDNHSVEIKKFSGTIWSALIGFGFSSHNAFLFGVALIILFFFGLLDIYYLQLERRFRNNFTEVMKILSENDSKILDNTNLYSRNFVNLNKLCLWQFITAYGKAIFSWANLPYLVLLIATAWIWRVS